MFCAIAAVLTAKAAPAERSGDKFAGINNDAGRTVEVVAQLSDDEVAQLGKRDGVSNTMMRGSIRANGFLQSGRIEVQSEATPEEVAEKAALKSAKGLRASIKEQGFAPEGSIERVNMRDGDADTKDGEPRTAEIPDDFVKTKEVL